MSKRSERIIGSRTWAISAALFALLLAVEPAFAAGRQSGSTRQLQEKAARKACLTGDYNNGVSILADLFIDLKNPIYIFNQGRCLEQNARYKDAIARFEEYLRIGDTSTLDPADRAAAEKQIEDCKAKLAEEEKAQVKTPQSVGQPSPQTPPQPNSEPDTTNQIVERTKAPPESEKSGRALVIGGIATGAVGVAAVVAGVIFNLKANSMADEMENTVDAYTSSKESSQKTYGTLAWVGYGVGAACIATGAVLVAVGASRHGSPGQTDVALAPAVGPGQAGVLVRGGF